MFNKNNSAEDSNFWISYADLMAGLLFVFILLIGAITSKSIMVQSVLDEKENSLEKSLQLVNEKESYILKKDKLIAQLKSDLIKNKNDLNKTKTSLKAKNKKLEKATLLLTENERLVKLRLSEISELNQKLLIANRHIKQLSKKVVIVQNLLDANASEHTNTLKRLQEYEGKVLLLSNALDAEKEQVKLKDEKLLELLEAMSKEKTKYDTLLENLQKQKQKIKRLTGIKLQVIAALKKSLGSKIHIDKKTGSLKLASNILFEVGESKLKDGAKTELKKAFEEYIGTLVTDKDIKPYLDKIIIEGHTDSDGDYIYNLKLSQDRALSVMEYLLTLDFSKKHNIKPLVVASGRSYLDIIKINGKEDKEASRRIEIKFRLKNEDAMQEIEKVLDEE
jgi:chemotaxis protein MotB